METTTDDPKLTALIEGLAGERMPPEKARTLLESTCKRLGARLDELPRFVDHVLAECPVINTNALLVYLIDTATLLGSLHACFFLAQVGVTAAQRVAAWNEARQTFKPEPGEQAH